MTIPSKEYELEWGMPVRPPDEEIRGVLNEIKEKISMVKSIREVVEINARTPVVEIVAKGINESDNSYATYLPPHLDLEKGDHQSTLYVAQSRSIMRRFMVF